MKLDDDYGDGDDDDYGGHDVMVMMIMVIIIIIIIIIIIVVVIVDMNVPCHRSFLPGTSLEPAVIPTAQASSFTLQYFPYYV